MSSRSENPLTDPNEKLAPGPRRRASARLTLRGMVVAFLVAALLGSSSLVGLAERQPFGWQRDALLNTSSGLDRVANLLSLNRPADLASDLRGQGRSDEAESLLAEAREAHEPEEVAEVAEEPVEEKRPPLRTVTPAEPLELYVGGDSMVRELGSGMKTVVEGEPVVSTTDFRVSSGLTREDFFDWPAHFAELVAGGRPEAMVLMFGANDYQGIKTDAGEIFQPGSEGWTAEYRSRVAFVMDLLDQPGTTLHWVGLPIMRSDSFSASAKVMNEVYRSEAEERPWVTYVSTYELFADANGTFAGYLDVGGHTEPMRQDDGIHWTSPGSVRAATAAFDSLVDVWQLRP